MIYPDMTTEGGYYAAELDANGFGDADDLGGLFSFVGKAAKAVGKVVGKAVGKVVAPVLKTVPGGAQALAIGKAVVGGGSGSAGGARNAEDRRHRDQLYQLAARGDQDAIARLKKDAASGSSAANRMYSAALLQQLGNKGLTTYQAPDNRGAIPGELPVLLQPSGGASGATGTTTFPTTPSDAGTPGYAAPADSAGAAGGLASWFLPVAIIGGIGVVALASGKSRGARSWE